MTLVEYPLILWTTLRRSKRADRLHAWRWLAWLAATVIAPIVAGSQARPATDTVLERAVAADRAYLQRAMHPDSAREAAWHRSDWKDPSPHRETWISAGDQRLELLDWGGRGTPMVLLPGMGHTAHIFDDLAPRFTNTHHVVALTMRGHGSSSAPSHPYAVDSLATDVAAAITALGFHDVVLVGHSLGGHVANRVAALYPANIARVLYLDAAKDSIGLTALRKAAPTMRPPVGKAPPEFAGRAHAAQRWLYFNYWSDAQEADVRNGRTAPEIPAMVDLLAPIDWKHIGKPQLDICALDTTELQFPWLLASERRELRARIAEYVRERFVPWERVSCDRFGHEAAQGTLIVVPGSNHYVFLVSPEQTYQAMRRWLER
jgi:pimeloyl-ACP methyl ester carboxylesterase